MKLSLTKLRLQATKAMTVAAVLIAILSSNVLFAQEKFAQEKIAQEEIAKEKIVVYNRNVDDAFVNEHIRNVLELSKEQFGEYEIILSDDFEGARAFAELSKGNIDIVVAAPSKKRESLGNMVYVPLDRGLLGFRLCLVHKDAPEYSRISTPAQFTQRKLTVGIGSNWPDRAIFEENGFTVVTSPVRGVLFGMLENKRFDCFSRSINEIDAELSRNIDKPFKVDENLVFIYPNSQFIFVNPKNESVFNRVSYGMGSALENNSYYEIFDKYYDDVLQNNHIYERKLVLMSNNSMSARTLSAINRFGMASFLKNRNQTISQVSSRPPTQ